MSSAFFAEERRGATFDDAVSVVRAAGAGQGLALARWSLVALDIESGRLAIASRKIIPIKSAYYFVCPASYLDMDKIAAFRTWIMEEARRAPRAAAEIMTRRLRAARPCAAGSPDPLRSRGTSDGVDRAPTCRAGS